MTAKTLVVLLVLSTCTPPPDESRRGATVSEPWIPPSHGLALLRSDAVATELRLSEEERSAAERSIAESRQTCGPPKADPIFWGEYGPCVHAAYWCPAEFASTLPRDKQKRLEQIQLQVAGGLALLFQSKVATDIGLNNEQNTKLAEIRKKVEAEASEAVSRMRFPSQEAMNLFIRTYAYRRPVSDRLLSVLTEEQRKKLNDMYGPKFDVDAYLREKGVPQ